MWRTGFGKGNGPAVRQTAEWMNEWMNELANKQMNGIYRSTTIFYSLSNKKKHLEMYEYVICLSEVDCPLMVTV
jgi:hypothetical protein